MDEAERSNRAAMRSCACWSRSSQYDRPTGLGDRRGQLGRDGALSDPRLPGKEDGASGADPVEHAAELGGVEWMHDHALGGLGEGQQARARARARDGRGSRWVRWRWGSRERHGPRGGERGEIGGGRGSGDGDRESGTDRSGDGERGDCGGGEFAAVAMAAIEAAGTQAAMTVEAGMRERRRRRRLDPRHGTAGATPTLRIASQRTAAVATQSHGYTLPPRKRSSTSGGKAVSGWRGSFPIVEFTIVGSAVCQRRPSGARTRARTWGNPFSPRNTGSIPRRARRSPSRVRRTDAP